MTQNRITWREQLVGMAFASPYLVGFLVFLAVPLALSLYYSFCDYPMLQPPMFIGLDNYTRLASDPTFYTVLRNTITFALASVPFTLTLSILLALLLNRPVPGQGIFRVIVFLPSIVPAVAAAALWTTILNGKQGLINIILNTALQPLGLQAPNWLGTESWVMTTLILLTAWGVGNTVVIFLAGLQDIPKEMYEAAQIDGAGPLARLRHVTLPMLSPVIFFNLIMGIIGSWQVFTMPYMLVGKGANLSGYFYTQYLFDAAFMEQRFGVASAMAWIQFLIILALTVIVFLTSRRWVHYR